MTNQLVIQPNEQDEFATCSCCAGMPGVSGFVYAGDVPLAVYFAEPTGMVNYPMLRLGIVIGRWGNDIDPSERVRAVFSCRPGPLFEIADPYLPTVPELTPLGQGLFPADAPHHPKLAELREVADAIIAGDPRLGEMRKEGRTSRFSADATDSGEPS